MDVEHAHLLVVDDDPELRELTQAYLQQQGFDVATVDCGESMDAYLNQHQVDLLILDLMLPGEHGLSIAQRLKSVRIYLSLSSLPKAMTLTVLLDWKLAQTITCRNLSIRVNYSPECAQCCGVAGAASLSVDAAPSKVQFGEFSLDLASHRLTQNGVGVSLTSEKFDLLAILVSHPNKVLHRDRILDLLTGAERSPFDRSIDVRVTRLRSKLEADPANPMLIKTIWGKGAICSAPIQMTKLLPLRAPASLLGRTNLTLGVSSMLIAVISTIALYAFVIDPIAERSADDEAALLVLSAQTWVELPPAARSYFELELAQNHDLIISSALQQLPAYEGAQTPIALLQQKLQNRLGIEVVLLEGR